MNDEELKSRLQQAYRATTSPPEFEAVWNAAEAKARRRSPWLAIAASVALVALAAVVSVNLWSDATPDSDGALLAGDQDDAWLATIDDSLLNATAWSAPSDALLPDPEPDLFNTIPTLIESTETEVDALL